jgi:competence protein CoiA
MSYVECVEAHTINGGVINAIRMTPAEWDGLQRTYKVGELLMPCCNGAAVPKVSPNGHPFFAHASGACSQSEESQWHQAAKHAVRATLEALGCVATVEKPGNGAVGRWQADVWGERGNQRIAVEIQHSYQHLRDYRDRQAKYREAGIRTLWLLRQDRIITLLNSMRKERHAQEFAGGVWPQGSGGFTADVPVACLNMDDPGAPQILRGMGLKSELGEVLEAVLSDRFIWVDGWWTLDTREVMLERIRLSNEQYEANIAAMSKPKRNR